MQLPWLQDNFRVIINIYRKCLCYCESNYFLCVKELFVKKYCESHHLTEILNNKVFSKQCKQNHFIKIEYVYTILHLYRFIFTFVHYLHLYIFTSIHINIFTYKLFTVSVYNQLFTLEY